MKTDTVSPFAPEVPPRLPPVNGVSLGAVEAGIKYRGRKDLLLVRLDPGSVAAGVTTQSRTCSAPVLWCRTQLAHGRARALVVNAGNANAFTGRKGDEAARMTAQAAAAALDCAPEDVWLASTGVIGEPLDASGFACVLSDLSGQLSRDETAWSQAAEAIMTTDTFAKLATATCDLDGHAVTINGIAKGSGMIAPDMATMLSFIFTDAAIAQPLLQATLSRLCETTFNCVTVDGDTSTSDTLLAFATGQSEMAPIDTTADPRYPTFCAALEAVLEDLAVQVAKDGEGITKFIRVHVTGAESDAAARRIALSIANSPLVKTAVAGEDANWGRVVMAVGKAGEAADRDRLEIAFGPHVLTRDGARAPDYDEAIVADYMTAPQIDIRVDVGVAGPGQAMIWTCDLTHGYIAINADYRS